ncbi:MAG: non-canonical purine NTP pyrophosphatase, partial [Pseudomonadota bacterium]
MHIASGDELVLASHNEGKVKEFARAFVPYHVSLVSAGALGLPEPAETGATFTQNALLKARSATEASGRIALADDSGLAVAGLDGAPGIFSARW